MTPVVALRGCVALLLAWLGAVAMGSFRAPVLNDAVAVTVEAQGPDLGTDAQRESGKALYVKNCAQCHGEKGDGEGYATSHLFPVPRNFTAAKFKVRTTPNGALPTHQDLVNVIRRGMPYTSMPAWPDLSEQQLSDLAYFLKTFSSEFSDPGRVPQPMELPGAPGTTAESIELGKKLYVDTGCVKCHGMLGRADGPSAPTLTDELGHAIQAANLTQPWTFRGGSSREDIFRTMTTGLNGTPMPSFTDSLSVEQRWAITDFIVSLSASSEPAYTNLVVAKPVQDPIDLAQGAASFEAAPVARFPILGQITEPGREFHPPATSLTVQAIYDADSVGLLVRWHDMSPQKTGKNGPLLPVPPEEEEGPSTPTQQAPDASDPFGQDAVAPSSQPAADPFAADTGDAAAAAPSEFSDAVAVQIPSQASTDARKPYFIFGQAQNPVDLLFFDLARSEPLQFTGKGSADVAPNDTGDLTGVASYDQGEWSVVFKRPLRASSGAPFTPREFLPIAFSVWDGLSRERGNKRGLTTWFSLYVEPEVVPSPVGPMVKTAAIILAIELALIWWVRRRYGSGAGVLAEVKPGQPTTTSA